MNAKDLSDWLDKAREMYEPLGAVFKGQPVEIHFPKGWVIRTGHLKDENAYTQYQGHEYQRILIEELTQIPSRDDYIKLISSCRSTIPTIKSQVFCTANPGNIGHAWVKNRWSIVGAPHEPVITPDGDRSRVFVPATVYDNPKLIESDPSYVDFLKNLPDESLRKSWYEGSWDNPVIPGLIYENELKWLDLNNRITEVPHNPKYPVYTYWDIGRDATPIIFAQKVGQAWHFIDFYENRNQSFTEYAKVIREKGYWYAQHFGPHDLAKTDMAGESIWTLAEKQGINFTVVPKGSIEDGIQATKSKLQTVYIDKIKCQPLLDRMRAYRREYDETRQVYKDTPVHDWASHASDALRYWAVTPDPVMEGHDDKFTLYQTSFT